MAYDGFALHYKKTKYGESFIMTILRLATLMSIGTLGAAFAEDMVLPNTYVETNSAFTEDAEAALDEAAMAPADVAEDMDNAAAGMMNDEMPDVDVSDDSSDHGDLGGSSPDNMPAVPTVTVVLSSGALMLPETLENGKAWREDPRLEGVSSFYWDAETGNYVAYTNPAWEKRWADRWNDDGTPKTTKPVSTPPAIAPVDASPSDSVEEMPAEATEAEAEAPLQATSEVTVTTNTVITPAEKSTPSAAE
ncbi:MAG: hypothetical protein COY40_06205 [Alphaproteobacteria bacterium CG_4_10_14_0_8_um_filter_53_9]|nr:MAG: hypothetical protein COY40_06205 [Alphaproteobacteria bacterium CG_4_10_14_0_8_um_filter_53_9]